MLLRGLFLLQTILAIVDSFFMGPLEQTVSNFSFYPSSSSDAPAMVSVGSRILCMRPTPIIKWYDTYGDLVSQSSRLIVTENMRHWKQPIILHCLAFNDNWFPNVKGIYTFQVDETFSSGGGCDGDGKRKKREDVNEDAAGEISFYPPSIANEPTTVAVGDVIQCLAEGIPSPTIKWYDYRWNEVSGWSGLNVTEEMRYWRQPLTFHCRAHNWLVFPGIEGSYTLQVAEAPSSEGDTAEIILTQFSPSSSSKDVAVGTIIRTIRNIWFKSSVIVSGQIQPAIRWYDTKWNELSVWDGLVVTEEMRHWEQPIILHHKGYNGLDSEANEGNYQLEVAGALSSEGDAVPLISFDPPSSAQVPATLEVGTIIQCNANGSNSSAPKIWCDVNWNVVSRSSQLSVTEDMRKWNQPITLYCTSSTYSTVKSSYTFQVTSNGLDAVTPTWISFYPLSSAYAPLTLTVGDSIECIANGMTSPTFNWYLAINWNPTDPVSSSSEVYVTEKMRHWSQPITLLCKAQKGWDEEIEAFYTFQVAGASTYSGTEAWVIAVAVIVPTVVIAAIAIAVLFIIRRREKKKMSTENTKPVNGPTAALLL